MANEESINTREDNSLLENSKRGCIACRMPVQLTSFYNDALEPGDHIEVRGKSTCFGDCYSHHAIVKEVKESSISEDGKTAAVHVIDIADKPDCDCCGENTTICCFPNTTPVKDHKLNDIETINCQEIKRIDYRKRMYDKKKSFENAKSNMPEVKQTYILCCYNCEHFTTKMIQGGGGVCQKCRGGVCQQLWEVCFFILHLVFFVVQVFFYLENFYLYAIVARNDASFNNFLTSNSLIRRVNETCHNPDAERGFETWCDWKLIGMIQGPLCFIFIFILIIYQCCFNMCALCKISHIVVSIFKIAFFILVDIINIYLEKILYFGIKGSDSPTAVTFVIIISLSMCETVLAYQLAYVCKKLVMCLCCRNCECCDNCTLWKCCMCFGPLKKCCTKIFTKCVCRNNMFCGCCFEICQIEMDEHYYKYKVV